MKTYKTKAIILNRIKFEEADNIITVLTPNYGKIKLMVKGARKSTSKLAGGIELFCESDISFIEGKNEIGTLISSRLINYYKNINSNLTKTNSAFKALIILDKNTEDKCDEDYYKLLSDALNYFNQNIDPQITLSWFIMQIIGLNGHTPNLNTDIKGHKLSNNQKYRFNYQKMAFEIAKNNKYSQDHIKLLRLYKIKNPKFLSQVIINDVLMADCLKIISSMIDKNVNV